MIFFHAALSVKNLEESKKFYEELFGLKEHRRGERPELGVKFVIMTDKNGSGVELFEHQTPVATTEDFMDFSNIGFKHVAFRVKNVDETYEKALTMGAKSIWDPRRGVTVKKLAFFTDPNGLAIEIVELN